MSHQPNSSELLFEFQSHELQDGINFLESNNFIVFVKNSKVQHILKNECQHMKGRFKKASSCRLECLSHGWTLDAETLSYSNPRGVTHNNTLPFTTSDSGKVSVFKPTEPESKDVFHRMEPKSQLSDGEFGISFYAHACVNIRAKNHSLFTDPWVTGPAFSRGWWLVHTPPPDWISTIANCSTIYLSHNHSDHMNEHSLEKIQRENPNVPIVIPDFEGSTMMVSLQNMGFNNVRVLPFYQWENLDADCRYMILPDASGRHDSGLLFEYKGHRIVTTVDCANCCNGELPQDVDVLLSSFAGGASGFPVCWEEQYPKTEIQRIVKNNRTILLDNIVKQLEKTNARSFIPYAGYFTEAHPDDEMVKKMNEKNSPQNVVDYLAKRCPDVKTHIPFPGDFFDLSSLSNKVPHSNSLQNHDTWNMAYYCEKLSAPLLSHDELNGYFQEIKFQGDLVLHIVETDDLFKDHLREYYVDFRLDDRKVFLQKPLTESIRYLRMKVRQDVFSYILKRRLPWEEISIGFQAQFFRQPDEYNYDFWHYMQNHV
ncbi:MAG: hypothetical protein AAF203_03390 [Pseudomonadota bacterium]